MADPTPPPPPGGKPKPPPAPAAAPTPKETIPIPALVTQIMDHVRLQGLPCLPQDVLVMVAPDIAAEVYRWDWLVGHPAVTAYVWVPEAKVTLSQYRLHDLIGTVCGYTVVVRGYLEPGCCQAMPFHMVAEYDRQQAAIAEARCRRPR